MYRCIDVYMYMCIYICVYIYIHMYMYVFLSRESVGARLKTNGLELLLVGCMSDPCFSRGCLGLPDGMALSSG